MTFQYKQATFLNKRDPRLTAADQVIKISNDLYLVSYNHTTPLLQSAIETCQTGELLDYFQNRLLKLV